MRALVRRGYDVVVDDLNLRAKYTRRWADLARELDVELEVWDFAQPWEVLRVRNRCRQSLGQRHLKEERLLDLYHRFPAKAWEGRPVEPSEPGAGQSWTPYEAPSGPGLSELIYLIDIDGTLAKKQTGPDSRGWYEYDRVGEDLPNPDVIEVVNDLRYAGARIIFMSGRKEHCREQTRAWLSTYLGEWTRAADLFMRSDDDNRSDDIVKHELFHEHIQGNYVVRGVLDDRDRVVALWRAIGLTVLQVDYANF